MLREMVKFVWEVIFFKKKVETLLWVTSKMKNKQRRRLITKVLSIQEMLEKLIQRETLQSQAELRSLLLLQVAKT